MCKYCVKTKKAGNSMKMSKSELTSLSEFLEELEGLFENHGHSLDTATVTLESGGTVTLVVEYGEIELDFGK